MQEPKYRDVVSRLNENNIDFAEIALQNNAKAIIVQLGGHVLGPFLGDGMCMTWLNHAYLKKEAFKQLLETQMGWLQGGARTLIAPEIQYNVRDRKHFFESYCLPKQINPGEYKIEKIAGNRYSVSQDMELDLFNISTGKKKLSIRKVIAPAFNPLRYISACKELMHEVLFCGYEMKFTLSEFINDDVLSEIWDLTQLKSGGDLYICASPKVEYTHYYEPIDEKFHNIYNNHVQLKLTGDRTYKIGYKAAHLTGKLGYMNRTNEGKSYLLIRNYFNNPSAIYAEEPYHTPGLRGHSLHVYNDDGNYGSFGEIECNGQTIGGVSGISQSTDKQTTWVFVGPFNKLKAIAIHLLGVDIDCQP